MNMLRNFTTTGLFVAGMITCLAIAGLSTTSAWAADKKPNIIVIMGDDIGMWNIRLVGFNTPEIRNAKCEDEGRLGR
jgi:hypothetical protein